LIDDSEILEHLPDAVVGVDPGGKIVLVNAQTEALFGYRREELIGQPIELLVPSSSRGKHVGLRETYVAAPTTRAMGIKEMPVARRDGSTFPAHIMLKMFQGITLAVVRDITTLKLTERALAASQKAHEELQEQHRAAQRLESIGRLAGGVAHDFNNLLTVIETYCTLLLDQFREGDPVREDLAVIQDAGRRGAALTNQLLTLGRRQVQKLALYDLNEVVGELGRMLGRLVGEDVEIVLQLGKPGHIRADKTQIEQILMNLVVNARDAMPEGGRLTIETQTVELDAEYAATHVGVKPGPYVLLAVSDTGTGMGAEVLARIFEPFFTTKGDGKGTGLGLASVYGIVKQHQGDVWVYSELGHGTTFKVYLPEVDPTTASGRLTPVRPPRPPAQGGAETILLVEDESVVRRAAARALKRAGYTVIEAQNAGEALLMFDQQAAIHMVLTDVVMPKMSGRQLVDQIHTRHPGMKVLYMSGYTDDAIVRNGVLEHGMPYLQKPFSIEGLLQAVRQVLDDGGKG
jgi:PAS domain S-box-containing protein